MFPPGSQNLRIGSVLVMFIAMVTSIRNDALTLRWWGEDNSVGSASRIVPSPAEQGSLHSRVSRPRIEHFALRGGF